jgi:hypothetical protein
MKNETPSQKFKAKSLIFPSIIGGIILVFIILVSMVGFFGFQLASTLPDRIDSLLARFDATSEESEGEVSGVSETRSNRTTNSDEEDVPANRPRIGDIPVADLINNGTDDPQYPDLNNDGILQDSEAPKPDDVDPEIERIVSELEVLLSKNTLTEEEYSQIEELFNELQVLQAQELQE